MTEQHIYHLSSIDQSLVRTYIRIALCFPCQCHEAPAVAQRLDHSLKRAVTHIPIIAGTVVRVKDDTGQEGRLEVSLTLKQVEQYRAIIRTQDDLQYPYDYRELSAAGMPPMALVNESLTPLPDKPDADSTPVFAVQANFISGGLILALYLHHSAADILGLATIIRQMSSDLPSLKLTDDDLRQDAIQQSRLRDRLSGARGVPPDLETHLEYNKQYTDEICASSNITPRNSTHRIFSFDLALIDATKTIINARQTYTTHRSTHPTPPPATGFDILATILWKAIARAVRPPTITSSTTLIVPLNIRRKISPPLPRDFIGNAAVHALIPTSPLHLHLPFEVSSLASTASLIRSSIASVTEREIRSRIATLNTRTSVTATTIPSQCFDLALVVTSWADIPVEGDLGLGLGPPEWVRKVGREAGSAWGCIVLPPDRGGGVWEVVVQVTEEVMGQVVRDEGVRKFVRGIC